MRVPRSPSPCSQISIGSGRKSCSPASVEARTALAQGNAETEAHVSCRKTLASSAAYRLPSRGARRVFTRPGTASFAKTQMQTLWSTLPPIVEVLLKKTSHPRLESRPELQVGRTFDRFRLCGVGMDHPAQIADFQFLRDCQNGLSDAFSRV